MDDVLVEQHTRLKQTEMSPTGLIEHLREILGPFGAHRHDAGESSSQDSHNVAAAAHVDSSHPHEVSRRKPRTEPQGEKGLR